MKSYSILLLFCILSGCATVVPVSITFPNVPEMLLEDPPKLKVTKLTNVKASDLLTTVVENYGTYYEIREKLMGWQTWYKEQKKIFEEAQK